MASAIHYSSIQFFEWKMTQHSKVARFTRNNGEDIVYIIDRNDGLMPVTVFLSDAYWFGRADLLGRPSEIKRGSFILITRPEASFDQTLIDKARAKGIGIGKIGKLMGALNRANVYEYKSPEERENNNM